MKYLFVFLLVGLVSCGDASQNENAKQPYCKDIIGLKVADENLVPKDYTGVAFKCVDGKVLWLRNYKDGELDGIHRAWRKNGQLRIERNFKVGKLYGLWRGWYDNGQLRIERNWKDDKQDGLERWWTSNGALIYERNWKDGELDGLSLEWEYLDNNGKFRIERNYKEGIRISKKCFDENGKEIECPQ